MRKGMCGVFVFCFMASNAWVCVAKDFEGRQCELMVNCAGPTILRSKHCTPEQETDGINSLCHGDDGRSTGVTTTTLPTDQLDGGLPTPCPQYQITVRCRWSNKSGTKGKHCTVTDQRLFSAQCGVVSQRRDGSRVFRYCVLRGF